VPSRPAAAFVAFAFGTPTKKVSFVSVSTFVQFGLGLPSSPVTSYKHIKHKAHQTVMAFIKRVFIWKDLLSKGTMATIELRNHTLSVSSLK